MDEVDGCSVITKRPEADKDIVCAPCLEDNIQEQAVKYCQQCQEFLCSDCVRHHEKNRLSRSHKLVDKDKANEVLDVAMTTKCLNHPDREIEMYCREHDMVYCLKCIVTDHKSCTGVTDIEELTSLSDQSNEFVSLQTDIDNVKERLENTNRKTQTNINSAEKQTTDAIFQIESMERDLVEHIRMLKNKTIENLGKEYTLVKDKFDANVYILDKAKQKIERASYNLKVFDRLDRKHQFIESKLVQKAIKDAREVSERCDTKGCQSVRFDENTELKSSIIKSTSLGRILREREGNSMLESTQRIYKINKFKKRDTLGSKSFFIQRETEDNRKARSKQRIYKVKSKKEIDITLHNDVSCYVVDICQLPDGTVLLADWDNNRIKRLEESYTIKDYFDVGSSPTAMCCIGNTEIAVRMSGKRVQFISVRSTFSKLRDISVSFDGFGMAYVAGDLWLSVGKAVAVYNKAGTELKTICRDVNGQCLFKSVIQQIAVCGDTIIVTDESDGAVCLNRNGTVERQLRDGRLRNATGVCVSSGGTVFIVGIHSYNIVMFDIDGKCLGELVDKVSGTIYPRSLLYDEKRNCLLVGCYGNTVYVYNL